MKKQKYKIAFAICPFILSCQLAAAAPAQLSLQDCVNLALQSNPSMRIAAENQEKSFWAIQQAKAQKGIHAYFVHQDQRTTETPSWINRILYPNVPAYNIFSNQLLLTYPLYSGEKLENQLAVASLNQKTATLNSQINRQQLIAEVTGTYYDVLARKKLLQNAVESADAFTAHLDNVQKQYDAGNVALVDVLQTKVRLADAQDGLTKAQNAYHISMYKLNSLMQQPLHNDLELAEPLNISDYPLTLEESIAAAMKQQSEITATTTNLTIAQKQVAIAKSANKPNIDLTASQAWWDSSNYPGTKDHSWTIGATIKLDVFDGGLVNAQKQQAEAIVKISTDQIKQKKDAVELEINQAYLGMQEAKKRQETNQVAIDHAQLDFKLAKVRFDAGIGTNLDLIDSEVALTQAKNNYTQALYDYNVSRVQLDKAIGKLAQADKTAAAP